jgi:hypothetical protein
MTNLSGISSETFIGKMLRVPLRLIPRTLVLPILQGALRGKKWTAGSATHGCWLGSYEYHKQKALQQRLKAGEVVYDIGANVGFYSLLSSVLVGNRARLFLRAFSRQFAGIEEAPRTESRRELHRN